MSAHGDKHKAHELLVERLRLQAADVRRLSSALDEGQLSQRTIAGKWSLKELICHLRRVQDVFGERLEAMLTQENPALAPYEPEGDAVFDTFVEKPSDESLTAFFESRERLVEHLAKLTPPEWHRKGAHPEFPNYDVHFQVEYMVHHEAHHIYQMFERRLPFGKIPH